MQHAQHSSTASASALTKAADSMPAQHPVQPDASAAPASMHHAGMQHADVQHAAHQASANPQLDHTRQSQADSDHDATDHASMQHGQQHGAMDHSDMDHAPHAGAVTQTPASPPPARCHVRRSPSPLPRRSRRHSPPCSTMRCTRQASITTCCSIDWKPSTPRAAVARTGKHAPGSAAIPTGSGCAARRAAGRAHAGRIGGGALWPRHLAVVGPAGRRTSGHRSG